VSLLRVNNLRVVFETPYGQVKAVDGVSFEIERGEVVGLVGESGSGKSTLGLSIMKLLPPNARILSTMRVGEHIAEALMYHYNMDKEEAWRIAKEVLESVGIPAERAMDYPHQMSGGMRQRVMIATAIALKPKLIIADEPTSALDVIVQDHILELLKDLRDRNKASIILITHDLSVTADIADRVLIMYAGRILEVGTVEHIYYHPHHPYTQGLLKSIPKLGSKSELYIIPGSPPDMTNPPSGCRFHPRCPYARGICMKEAPPLVKVEKGHLVACWLYIER